MSSFYFLQSGLDKFQQFLNYWSDHLQSKRYFNNPVDCLGVKLEK